MASTTCAFGIASGISAQKARSRVASFFCHAGPSPEHKLGGAMVAAAAQLGRCHQAEVQAALSEGVPTAERRKILRVALLGAAALLPSTEASAADDQGVASSRMSYSRFLEYLDLGRVRKVDLYENGTIAIVEAVSPELGNRVQRVRVQLPGTSSELFE